jgi:hypothetical protein
MASLTPADVRVNATSKLYDAFYLKLLMNAILFLMFV